MINKELRKVIEKSIRVCPICNKQYIKKHPFQKFCSKKCRDINYKKNHKEVINRQINKWRNNNRELVKKQARDRYKKNPKARIESAKRYRLANRIKINKKARERYRNSKK